MLDTVLASLLSRYPEAPVAVLKADGISTPVPDSIRLARNRVLEGRSGLDLVVQEDRLKLLASWDQILAKGSARNRALAAIRTCALHRQELAHGR